ISSVSSVSAKPPISADDLINYLDGKENWYGVYIATKKLGYAYERWKKEFHEGETVFKAEVGFALNTDYYKAYFEDLSTFSLKGDRNLMTQSVYDKLEDYDENGKKIGSDEKQTNVTIDGTDYVVQTIKNEESTEVRIPFFPIDIRKYHFDVFILNNDFASELGTTKFVSGIDLDSNKPEFSIIKKITRDSVLKNGKLIPKTSILAVQGLNTQFEVEALVEYHGLEAMRLEMLGNWLLVSEPEQKAKDPGETLKLKDIENFPINQIVKYKDISELKLKIDGIGAEKIIVENDRQQILSSSINSIEILLKKNYQISNDQEDNIQLYLESTEDLPLNLPELKKINPIKDNDLSNLKKSEILNRFVHNFIEYTVRPEGPKLKAIIKEKKGDCSEYASLMTALARLNGIPAREVSGYAYTDENNSPSFGAHAWVELYINGSWREFDPTWDETKLGIEHILFKDATMLVGGSIEVLN
ncbi:transglutaminase domain-containing protein, partial [Paracoccaceae bacterium]|nr:transglutaminase domain-containing protein [Paracoccaceae bacterium]